MYPSVPDHMPYDLDIIEGGVYFLKSGNTYPLTYVGEGVADGLGEFAYESDKKIEILNIPFEAVRKPYEDEISDY